MKTKIIQFIPAIVALVAIGFRYFTLWCVDSVSSCYGTLIHQIALSFTKPLYFYFLYFLPVAIVLVFIPRIVFNSWLKFAAWAIPLSIIYVAVTPVVDNSLIPFNRDDAARLAGGVFAAASLLLVLWRALRSARAK